MPRRSRFAYINERRLAQPIAPSSRTLYQEAVFRYSIIRIQTTYQSTLRRFIARLIYIMPARDVTFNGRGEQQSHHSFKTLWMEAADGRGGSPRPVIKTTTAAELLKSSMPDVREELNVLIEVHYSSLNFKDGENFMSLWRRRIILRAV